MMSLSESDTAFNGLEDVLTEIIANNVKYISQWDFYQLRNLRKLRIIYIRKLSLGAIDNPLPHLPELTTLRFIRAEVSHITDGAFSNLPKLMIFDAEENQLTDMKRSMFSNPANNLSYIDLR